MFRTNSSADPRPPTRARQPVLQRLGGHGRHRIDSFVHVAAPWCSLARPEFYRESPGSNIREAPFINQDRANAYAYAKTPSTKTITGVRLN